MIGGFNSLREDRHNQTVAHAHQAKRRRRISRACYLAEPLEPRVLLSATPELVSIDRATPAAQITAASSVTFAVTFNEPVSGVAAADFQVAAGTGVSASASVVVSPTSGYNSVYAVTVNNISGDGTLGLKLENTAGIGDASGRSLASIGGNGTFEVTTNYGVYNGACSVAVADFNSDGIADLTVANLGNGTTGAGAGVCVLLGKGDGTFQPAVNYVAGLYPDSVVVGDFNGDRKLDLAVADGGSWNGTTFVYSGVSVLLGNGDGTFQAAVAYAAGNSPESVAVGDFNGDSKSDLAVANSDDNTASVLLGNGDGTFQPAVNYAVGPGPVSVAVADFNGDGIADLAVTDWGGWACCWATAMGPSRRRLIMRPAAILISWR